MKQVTIYTDGACSGNPGPGGWGAVLIYNGFRREMSGYEPHTTNNRMEMTAAIEALSALREPCSVSLYSDSSYLVNAFVQRWLVGWQRRDWIKSDKKPVENKDLWMKLLALTGVHAVSWIKVKGHADNAENNRCDELATLAIKQAQDAAKM
ncbi:MAG: ribonuclease HI [Clostridia bacterium]|nr:ribonuclease HI [Clostridia bacterium]MBR4443624.1 ribonuclease HI [Clostridia bacterium]